jgi:hypothetical protein
VGFLFYKEFIMKFEIELTDDAILDTDMSDYNLRKLYIAIKYEIKYRMSILQGKEDDNIIKGE